MKKILLIGWKDVVVAFRDRAALILMLAAPFLLTLGLGLVTGRFFDSNASVINIIPVVIVNQDRAELGHALVELAQSEELADLLSVTLQEDAAAARAAVDADEAAAAVIVPAGFSQSIFTAETSQVVAIELYENPTRPTSVGVVRAVLDGFLSQVEFVRVNSIVTVSQLIKSGYIQSGQAAALAQEMAQRASTQDAQNAPITLRESQSADNDPEPAFDILMLMAPGMALMFLMYTVTNGGRSLLSEKLGGTLPRLLVAPLSVPQALAGKALGIYLTGVLQMLILIAASALLFSLRWGTWLPVLTLVLAAVLGALGWGLLITVISKTPGQVANIGSTLMLIFGILGGSFFDISTMPAWVQTVARITPNSWALDGFLALAMGDRFEQILPNVAALVGMGVLLFSLSVLIFLRRGGLQSWVK